MWTDYVIHTYGTVIAAILATVPLLVLVSVHGFGFYTLRMLHALAVRSDELNISLRKSRKENELLRMQLNRAMQLLTERTNEHVEE